MCPVLNAIKPMWDFPNPNLFETSKLDLVRLGYTSHVARVKPHTCCASANEVIDIEHHMKLGLHLHEVTMCWS